MSKITKLVSQVVMELQNCHKVLCSINKGIHEPAQKKGGVNPACEFRAIHDSALIGGALKVSDMFIGDHLVSPGPGPVRAFTATAAADAELAKTNKAEPAAASFEHGESLSGPHLRQFELQCVSNAIQEVMGKFNAASEPMDIADLDKIVAAEKKERPELFPAIGVIGMGSGQNSHEHAMGQKQAEVDNLRANCAILHKARRGSNAISLMAPAHHEDDRMARRAVFDVQNALTPCFVMGMADALSQARAVAMRLAHERDAALEGQKKLAVKLDKANRELQVTQSLKRAVDAYLDNENKTVDAISVKA